MTLNTLQRFQPMMNFIADRHFTYIIAQADGHKEQLQSYYKLTEEDLEDITKEWSIDLLIPANLADISDIDSPKDTHKDQTTPGTSRQNKTKEVQNLISTLGKTPSVSPD
jgi:SET domain-containing protein